MIGSMLFMDESRGLAVFLEGAIFRLHYIDHVAADDNRPARWIITDQVIAEAPLDHVDDPEGMSLRGLKQRAQEFYKEWSP